MSLDLHIEPVATTRPIELPASLGFGRVFTDRMFTQRYSVERGWHAATIGPYRPLTLDPATTVYHNGQMIFDGTKAYRRPDGDVDLFRTVLNAERFNTSAIRMGMPPVAVAEHLEAIRELVRLEHAWVPIGRAPRSTSAR